MEAPPHLKDNEMRSTKLHVIRYIIVNNNLWWRNFEGIVLKSIDQEKSKENLNDTHSRVCGGHYMVKTTSHKITRPRFWWPTLFKDAMFRFLKSTQSLISPFFFLRSTRFDTQVECVIGLTIPPSLSFINSSCIFIAKVGFTSLFFCLKGFLFSLSGMTFWKKSSL